MVPRDQPSAGPISIFLQPPETHLLRRKLETFGGMMIVHRFFPSIKSLPSSDLFYIMLPIPTAVRREHAAHQQDQ
jgi:hypothetical protein